MPKPKEWSNQPASFDEEMRTPTPREQKLTELADKAKEVVPARYNITSKNPKAVRVVHDHEGNVVTIPPGETKQGVLLRPDIAEYLGRGDLSLVASA
jgi:hypothetical protein